MVVKSQKFVVLISEKPYMIISHSSCNADSEFCVSSVFWGADLVTNELNGKFDYHNQNTTFQIAFCKYRAQEFKMSMNTLSSNGCYI